MKKIYIISGIILYVFIFLFYWLTSKGAENYRLLLILRRFLPCVIASVLATYLWKEKAGYSLQQLWPIALVSGAWIIVFNIISYLSDVHQAVNINNFKDIIFGLYFFACVIFGMILVQNCPSIKIRRIVSHIFCIITGIIAIIPIIHLGYFLIYGQALSVSACIAVFQTNPKEAEEFFQQNIISVLTVAFFCVFVSVFVGLKQKACFNSINQEVQLYFSRKTLAVFSIFELMLLCYIPIAFAGSGFGKPLKAAHQYFKEAKAFRQWHEENYSLLDVKRPSKTMKTPSTIILVIGESASRNFMSAYGYKVHDTTPLLRQATELDAKHFLKFEHAYASYGVTVNSLERALTEKNQYNHIKFSQAYTILDLAKKAGFTTYWFSNQSIHNSAETPVALIAKTADHYQWLDDILENQNKVLYDGDLLPCLKMINPNENNFVVIHIMGSHELTLHRYPVDFAKFSTLGEFNLVSNYEDSLAYTDWFLNQVFEYGKKNLNLQVMLYFSDHGANPYRKRVPTHSPFSNLRIPLIVYLSDDYQTIYPESSQNLRKHINSYFTNDLLYEMVGGILNLQSSHIPECNSLTSTQYKWTRDSLKTNLGENSLSEDKHESDIDYGKY